MIQSYIAEDIRRSIEQALREANMTRTELAQRIGISRAAVTHWLTPGYNLTVKSIARIFHAIDPCMRVKITFE